MRIGCPTCSSRYDLAPGLLQDGRILRCAHCRDAWVHRPEPAPGPEIAVEAKFGRPEAAGVAAVPPSRPRSRRPELRLPPGAAASLLLAALVGGGITAVAGKEPVVAAFPPSEAVYATLGLPVNLSGLRLGGLRSTVLSGDGPPLLTLEGDITNIRSGPTPVPALRIAIRGRDSRELYHWTAPAPKAQLAAGETVRFQGRLTSPPRGAEDLAVSFAELPSAPRPPEAAPPGER